MPNVHLSRIICAALNFGRGTVIMGYVYFKVNWSELTLHSNRGQWDSTIH